MKIRLLIATFALTCLSAFAQNSGIINDVALGADGRPKGGASIRVCASTATGTPCAPLATVYSDIGLSIPKSQPFTADAQGNYNYYGSAGLYKEQVTISGTTYTRVVQVAGNAVSSNANQIQSRPVDSAAPSNYNVLQALSGVWAPAAPAAGDTTNTTLCAHGSATGQLTMGLCGTAGGGDAVTIQTNTVASGTPNKGEGYFSNGTTLKLRKGGYDNHADDWTCDKMGATSAVSCLQSVFDAVTTSTGQSVKLASGTYLIDSPLHIRRQMTIDGSGGGYSTPATTLQLGPGGQIVCDKSTVSADGGSCDSTVMRNVFIKGKAITCTATATSGVLASCNANPSTILGLSANDYLVGMGTSSSLWRLWFPQGTQVTSTTSNSITLAGGAVSAYSGTVTVMKSGYVNGSGTTANSSTSITGVATACALWQPGDPIQGPGIPYPDFVTACNTGASTLTLATAASTGFGAGNLTKGPLANLAIHGGSLTLYDVAMDLCAGFCYDNNGSANYTPATVADAQFVYGLRVTHSGDALVHFQGADSNAGIISGVQGTYGANGCIYSQSFLGNIYIGPECASSDGYPYQTTNANATEKFDNAYIEGGQKNPKYASQTLVIGGQGQGRGAGGISNGNYTVANGRMSPNYFVKNLQSGSTATCANASASLTNVTNIAQWHVGDTINGDCLAASSTVTATDAVSVLTVSPAANSPGDLIPITQTVTKTWLGTSSASNNAVLGFGYSTNNSSDFGYLLELADPAIRAAGSFEPGFFSWRYRNSTNAMSFPTDLSTNADDQITNPGTTAPIKFANGIRVGGTSNAPAIRSVASASAPTTLEWQNGSMAISTTAGLWQQRNAGKSTTGLADTTSGSATIANQDANFLARCATNDRVSGTGIQAATYLVDQNTLSKSATATNAGITVTCKRIAKAHVVTTCDTHTNTTLDNCSSISGWAANDTIQGTGIAAGTFISGAPSGSTITLSKATTATASGVTVSDATWGAGIFTDTAGVTSMAGLKLTDVASGTQCLHASSTGAVTGTGADCGTGAGGYSIVRDEGTPLTARTSLSMEGAGVTCSDDSGNTRTKCTIPGTAGGLPDPVANGWIAETGAGTTAARTFVAGSTKISISNTQGIAGNPSFDVVEANVDANNIANGVSPDNAIVLTNKTLDAEGTGNVVTMPIWIVLPAAGCSNTTASAAFDLPTSGAAVADCFGTTTTTGVLDFLDGATTAATAHFTTPADWDTTKNLDVTVYFGGDTASTNAIRWQVSTACVADGESTIAPSYNAASAANAAGPATIGFRKSSVFSNVTKTNCAAGETMWIKVERVGANGGDTYVGVGQLIELGVTLRRTM